MKANISPVTRNTLISLLVVLLSYFSFSLPSYFVSLSSSIQFRPSALQLALEPLLFGGVVFLLVICASAAFAPVQVEELQSQFAHSLLMRSSWRKYASRNIGKAALSGAIVVGGSFLIHSIVFNIIAQPYDVGDFPYHHLPFIENSFSYTWQHIEHGLPIYLFMSLCHGFFGAVWALIALCISVWFMDKLLAVSIPLCISWAWIRFPARHLGIPNLRPSALVYEDLDWHWFILSIIMYSIISAICIWSYMLGLKKRVANA